MLHWEKPLKNTYFNDAIISAVRGTFGRQQFGQPGDDEELWVSPLMTTYWFFDLPVVATHHLFLPQLRGTETFMEVANTFLRLKRGLGTREGSFLNLS